MVSRLVTIGDSLTQGFQHGAIHRTAWPYPALVARSLGLAAFRQGDFMGAGYGGRGSGSNWSVLIELYCMLPLSGLIAARSRNFDCSTGVEVETGSRLP